MGINNKVYTFRTYHGYSQRELARMVGTGHATISDIEAGRSLPNVLLAIRIARALKTTVERLWEGETDAGE